MPLPGVSLPVLLIGGADFTVIVLNVFIGIVIICEWQVGIVIKKLSQNNLPAGRLVALSGERYPQSYTKLKSITGVARTGLPVSLAWEGVSRPCCRSEQHLLKPTNLAPLVVMY